MTTKTTAKQAKCTAAYKAEFAKAATLLKLLNHYVKSFGNEDPTTVHWGHVGDAQAIVESLRNAAALIVNIDPVDPDLPAALAAYSERHSLK